MKKLIAKKPILFESKQYMPGDSLPAHDNDTVNAWIKYASAEWTDEAEKINTPSPTEGSFEWYMAKTVEQLKQIAKELGLDISKAKNKTDMSNLIIEAKKEV